MFGEKSFLAVVFALWFQALVVAEGAKKSSLRASYNSRALNRRGNAQDGDEGDDGTGEDGEMRTFRAPLLPSTGFNDICGEKIVDTIPHQMQYTAMYNSIGTQATPLTPEMCSFDKDELVATYVDKKFYEEKEWPLPDDRLLNLPYHEVPISVGMDGTRAFVPNQMTNIAQPTATHSIPNRQETIASFTSVTGEMHLLCNGDGTSYVTIEGLNYAPNSVLTVWVLWSNHVHSGLAPLTPMALGGVPNMALVDKHGEFRFERALNFCPLDKQNNGHSVAVAFTINKHLDGGCTYGNVQQHVLSNHTFVYKDGTVFKSSGVGSGVVTVDQGHITINSLNETDWGEE